MKTQRQPEKGPLDRIKELEQGHQVMMRLFTEMGRRMGDLALSVEALIQLAGTEKVMEKRDEVTRTFQANEILQKIQQGLLVQAEKIGPESTIVGVDRDAEGHVAPPGRFQVAFTNLVPSVKDGFLGLGVGGVFEKLGGGTLMITEVYDPAPAQDPTPEGDQQVLTPIDVVPA